MEDILRDLRVRYKYECIHLIENIHKSPIEVCIKRILIGTLIEEINETNEDPVILR